MWNKTIVPRPGEKQGFYSDFLKHHHVIRHDWSCLSLYIMSSCQKLFPSLLSAFSKIRRSPDIRRQAGWSGRRRTPHLKLKIEPVTGVEIVVKLVVSDAHASP